MISTFICRQCGQELPRNPRIKEQKYCSEKICQQTRMRLWKGERYTNNPDYRQKCLDDQKLWRKNRPAHQYQRDYREGHPRYVERNRKLQGKRTAKRQKSPREPARKIVNRNAIFTQPSNGNLFALMQVINGKIVNRNAIMVKMHLLSEKEMIMAINSV